MTFQLKTHYAGADLVLNFESQGAASLHINGMQRESITTDEKSTTIKLSSTVQTAYEWHEYIEAVVIYGRDSIDASIYASQRQLVTRSFRRTKP